MDYYAAWPAWKMPKWVGVTLGGVFTAIVAGCAWMIVDLTRAPMPRLAAAVSAAATSVAAAPNLAAPKAAAPNAEAAKAAVPADSAPAAVAKATPENATPAIASRAEKKATKRASDLTPARKRSILAKHESKSNRQAKTDLDRLLGL